MVNGELALSAEGSGDGPSSDTASGTCCLVRSVAWPSWISGRTSQLPSLLLPGVPHKSQGPLALPLCHHHSSTMGHLQGVGPLPLGLMCWDSLASRRGA